MTAPAAYDADRPEPARADAGRQQERSRTTRQRLLEATIDCLVDHGWAGTTTTLVADRAGLSRGAQLHHYPTKAALVADAVRYLAQRRGAELRAKVRTAGGAGTADRTAVEERVGRTVDLLAGLFTGPLYAAALEVWVVARTDPALREALLPVEAHLGREMHRLAVEVLGADESRPGVREAVQATLDLLRGLGVTSLLTDDAARRASLLRAWKAHLTAVLLAPEATDG